MKVKITQIHHPVEPTTNSSQAYLLAHGRTGIYEPCDSKCGPGQQHWQSWGRCGI